MRGGFGRVFHARWIFALLAHVDQRLTGDEVSTLRGLARGCVAVIKERRRAEGKGKAQAALPLGEAPAHGHRDVGVLDEQGCWLIIAAVSDFWGQKDLWMEAESSLSE